MKKQKIELLVLAAGLGSRYQGLKQMDSFGPSGETLMEFSLYDAIQAGFDRVVFVIKRDFAESFQTKIVRKYEHLIEIETVFQDMQDLPEGFSCPSTREKPWGTGHAVWVARNSIQNPFAVINADDFYGASGYQSIADFLREQGPSSQHFAMVGYPLKNTLSSNGTVNRGVIEVEEGLMTQVIERESISLVEETPQAVGASGERVPLQLEDLVSMNFWGFTPAVFALLETGLQEFLTSHIDAPKVEFYLPTILDQEVANKAVTVQVIPCEDQWIGVTYPEDKQVAIEKINRLLEEKRYPKSLSGN